MNRDLSLRSILSEWVREVVGIEGRLPRTFGKLFAQPGFLSRATLAGERDAYLSALKLFLVANLVVFLVGPYVGAVAFGLDGYLDERVASSAFFRAFVERELLDLGMSAETYELRFDFTIAQHAPTFFFLMIPAIASLTKVLLPSRLFGEHLVYATDFVAWVLVVILFGNIFMRVMGIPLDSLLEDPMVSRIATLAVVATPDWADRMVPEPVATNRLRAPGRGALDANRADRRGPGRLAECLFVLPVLEHGCRGAVELTLRLAVPQGGHTIVRIPVRPEFQVAPNLVPDAREPTTSAAIPQRRGPAYAHRADTRGPAPEPLPTMLRAVAGPSSPRRRSDGRPDVAGPAIVWCRVAVYPLLQNGAMKCPLRPAFTRNQTPVPTPSTSAKIDASTPNSPPENSVGPLSCDSSRPSIVIPETRPPKMPPWVKFQAKWMPTASQSRRVST